MINDRADTLLPASRQRLQQGDTILIFPEGTRTVPGEKMQLQRGAANIAVRCGSDLRVVVIRCTEHMLGKQSNGTTRRERNRYLPLKSENGYE